MNSGLTEFVRQAIDCYESDSDVAWFHLENAQTQLAAEKGARTQNEERKAAKSSMKRTRGAMKARLLEPDLPPSEKVDTLAARLEELPPSAKVSIAAYWEYTRKQRQQAHLEHLLDVIVWKQNQGRKNDGEAGATRKDILASWSEDEILSIEECVDWKEIEREYELALRREPDFELFLLRRQLDWIDSSAGKIEEDGPILFRSLIPDHLKRYMFEARWCDLRGLDAACASLCGAVLQEAIRIKMNRTGFSGLDEAIGAATEVGLFTPRAEQAAEEVKELRNLAAHGNQEFIEKPEDRKKNPLALTGKLLDTIFATES
jgi:hypothetical protein